MVEVEWYYSKDGVTHGPITEPELLGKVVSGELSKATLVWSQDSPDWKPLGEVFDEKLPPPMPFSPTPLPVKRRRGYATGDALAYGSWSDTTPHPWRRYFGRQLDTLVNGSIGYFVLFLVLYGVAPNIAEGLLAAVTDPSGKFLDIFVTVVAAMPINAIFIGLTGSTLGKYIFGVCILDANGEAIGFVPALRRELMIWVYGLGLGIPIVSLITMITAYQKLKSEGITSWDHELGFVAKQRSKGRIGTVFGVFGITLIIVVSAAIKAMGAT